MSRYLHFGRYADEALNGVERAVKNLVRELRNEVACVRLVGTTPDQELPTYYQACNLFCQMANDAVRRVHRRQLGGISLGIAVHHSLSPAARDAARVHASLAIGIAWAGFKQSLAWRRSRYAGLRSFFWVSAFPTCCAP